MNLNSLKNITSRKDLCPETINSKIELITLENDNKEYVLKTCPSSLENEFKIMTSIKNKNIAKPKGMLNTNSYMIKYYPKGNFASRSPMKSNDLVLYFLQMCKTIEYLHSLNICHLDIKLANFVESNKRIVKLIDFGHAMRSNCKINTTLGTHVFNSPERYTGSYNGLKADIYSLGKCLLLLMTGFTPFRTVNDQCPKYKAFKSTPNMF